MLLIFFVVTVTEQSGGSTAAQRQRKGLLCENINSTTCTPTKQPPKMPFFSVISSSIDNHSFTVASLNVFCKSMTTVEGWIQKFCKARVNFGRDVTEQKPAIQKF